MIAHEVLVRRFKILHKDISIYNLMFIQSRDHLRRGLLIDFDYAGDLDKERRDATRQKAMNYTANSASAISHLIFPHTEHLSRDVPIGCVPLCSHTSCLHCGTMHFSTTTSHIAGHREATKP